MDKQRWAIYIQWDTHKPERHEVESTEALKDYLDRHAFCERHGCPMPQSVEIARL